MQCLPLFLLKYAFPQVRGVRTKEVRNVVALCHFLPFMSSFLRTRYSSSREREERSHTFVLSQNSQNVQKWVKNGRKNYP